MGAEVTLGPGGGVGQTCVGDTLVLLWRDDASRERWSWQLEQINKLLEQCPNGIIVVSLILPTSRPPDAALRKQIQRDFGVLGPKLRRMIFTPLGDTLWLSIVRTLVKGALLFSGQTEKQRVAESLEGALREVALVSSSQTPSRAVLRDCVRALRAALGVPETDFPISP